VPRFEAFRALRYAPELDLEAVCSPPYDVLTPHDRESLASLHPNNIVHIDLPIGEEPYIGAATILERWLASGVLVVDDAPSLTIYRMSFTDSLGAARQTVGVIGALEVVDEGAGGVLPHEHTMPKAKTDRLDLTRATDTNLSPVWGLSMSATLTETLDAPGQPCGSMIDGDGVTHSVERVSDPSRLAAITKCVADHDVIIADGHHRYAISRTYRDEVRSRTNRTDTDAELTLTYINELVDEQLSVAAIHRLYKDITLNDLRVALGKSFDITPAPSVGEATLAEMQSRGSLCLVQPNGAAEWLTPMPEAFLAVRNLDSAMLEHALRDAAHTVGYQHGVKEVTAELLGGNSSAAILIRPVSVAEIRRTATEGLLMPPKSTFFTPKLRTGLVLRKLNTR
jgi:uncharacterized protein (DUF1015 family)